VKNFCNLNGDSVGALLTDNRDKRPQSQDIGEQPEISYKNFSGGCTR
jgi:hypothetical protein